MSENERIGEVPAKSPPGTSKMAGYLMKKSTAGDWQKRYFETNGSFLTYYKSQKMSKLLAALSLPQVGDIRLATIAEGGDSCTFQLDLKDRLYILKAETAQEANEWIEVLINLRDGGVTSNGAAKKTGSSPAGKEAPVTASAFFPSGKADIMAPGAPEVGTAWVKNQGAEQPSMDQCAAGCSVS